MRRVVKENAHSPKQDTCLHVIKLSTANCCQLDSMSQKRSTIARKMWICAH